jgi:hypothetical protein
VNGARLRVALLYVTFTLRRGKRMTLVRLTTSRVLCLLCAGIVCSGPLWFSLAPSSSLLLALGIAIALITWARRARHAINTAAPRYSTRPALTTATNEDQSVRISTKTRRQQRRVMVPTHRRSALRRKEANPRQRAWHSRAQALVENAPRIWPSTERSSRYVH